MQILTQYSFLSGFILFLSIQTVSHGSKKIEGKIIGGTPAQIESYPHTVQLCNLGALCAGTILSSWIVMTAAHCFDYNQDVNEMDIYAGARYTFDMTADMYNVWYIIRHEDYNKAQTFACDIALLFVKKPIKFSDKVRKAVLVNTNEWMKAGKSNFAATGWGWTKYKGDISQDGLRMTHLSYVPLKKCIQLHNLSMTPDMFCLYGEAQRDTCKGDSGGGIMWHEMIVGIVSHGDGCAQVDKPSVYSNVWYFRRWIEDNFNTFRSNFCNKSVIDEIDMKM